MTNITDYMLKMLSETKKATGADFSKHKGAWTITEEILPLLRLVMDFLIIRIGYGAADGKVYKDSRLEENYAKIIQWFPFVLRGGYWYFSSNSTWRTQYDAMKEWIQDMKFHILVLDFEEAWNTKSKGFALGGVAFLEQMAIDFPDVKIFVYANRYTYDGWMSPYTNGYDKFPLWIAQYPWKNWLGILTDLFRDWWDKFFNNEKQPTLPKSRQAGDWDIWQIGDATMIGNELGFQSDELDFNITNKEKPDFYFWVTGEEHGEPGENPEEPEVPVPHPDYGELEEAINAMAQFRESFMDTFGQMAQGFQDVLEDLEDAFEDIQLE